MIGRYAAKAVTKRKPPVKSSTVSQNLARPSPARIRQRRISATFIGAS